MVQFLDDVTTFLAFSLFLVGSGGVGIMLLLKMSPFPHSENHQNPHDAAGVADPCQVRGDVLPNADAALADALSSCQLHEKQRNADDHQKKNIQQHKGPWRKRRSS